MNAHGDVRFQNAFDCGVNRNHFTPVNPSDNKMKTFENSQSVYFPDQRLASLQCKPVAIPELRNFAGYYGTKLNPSQNGGYANTQQIQDKMYGFDSKDSFKPNHKGFSDWDLPRSGSARM
jgi:hypothetical protein